MASGMRQPCPTCGVGPGEVCTVGKGKKRRPKPKGRSHVDRMWAAQDAARGRSPRLGPHARKVRAARATHARAAAEVAALTMCHACGADPIQLDGAGRWVCLTHAPEA